MFFGNYLGKLAKRTDNLCHVSWVQELLVLRGQDLNATENLLDGLHVVHMLDESYGIQDLNEIARDTLPLSGISKVSLLFNLNLERGSLVNQLLENR